MTAMISRDVVEGYRCCPTKAYLKLNGERGTISDYEAMVAEARENIRLAAIDRILQQQPTDQVERGIALNTAVLKRGVAFFLDAIYEDGTFSLRIDGLQKVSELSKLGPYRYVPMLFCGHRHIRKEQKRCWHSTR